METSSESKLKLRAKLINERFNGLSLLLKWELIFQLLNSSQECFVAEHRTESEFSKRDQVENYFTKRKQIEICFSKTNRLAN
jgi:hypothetical protein